MSQMKGLLIYLRKGKDWVSCKSTLRGILSMRREGAEGEASQFEIKRLKNEDF